MEVVGRADLPHLARFLMRHIRHDDAVHAGRLEVRDELLEAVVVHVVDVAHADQRDFRELADLAHDLEFLLEGHAILQRADRSRLDDGTVCHGVREGQAELDDVSTGLLRLANSPKRRLHVWRTSRDIDENPLFAGCLEFSHLFIQTRAHQSISSPRTFATICTSLSPRPESVTTTDSSGCVCGMSLSR